MKILYHHRTRAEDAQRIHIMEMVRAFRELGHEVKIVALSEEDDRIKGKSRRKQFKEGSRPFPNWLYEVMTLGYNVYGFHRLREKIKSWKPDLIYERYSLNTFCGVWGSKWFNLPLLLEVNAPLYYEQMELGRLAFKRFAAFSERWICSNSTWTIVVSGPMKDILIQEGVPTEIMVVMPNGVDIEKFNPSVSGKAIRERYGLENKIVVGFVGWFRKWHGIEMLLELMKEAKLGESGVSLLLVGDGPAFEHIKGLVDKNAMGKYVVLTGARKREEIPEYIAAMDIAVQPRVTKYACPMKILEYMGMGKCIVAVDQRNIRELLRDRVTGLLFDSSDPKSMLNALREASENPVSRLNLGKRAYEEVLKRGFLWKKNAERAVDLARKLSCGSLVEGD
jgi:glycosyltransferase involved in cell wall biosynthesis